VERLSDVTMQEETEQLGTARGILDDLNDRLGCAIELWSHLTDDEKNLEPPSPAAPPPQRVVEDGPALAQQSRRQPKYSDPAVGTTARYTHQWADWASAPTMHNPSKLDLQRSQAPAWWWMQEQDHYGLCQPLEQGQLESSARAAQFNRAHAPIPQPPPPPPPPPARHGSFAQEKNLRPGNIWTDRPRYPIPDDDEISPRTV
ncbi:uncharacterized protein THITE_2018417, partial [Thermothielavioides terrestris NRRL 8126]